MLDGAISWSKVIGDDLVSKAIETLEFAMEKDSMKRDIRGAMSAAVAVIKIGEQMQKQREFKDKQERLDEGRPTDIFDSATPADLIARFKVDFANTDRDERKRVASETKRVRRDTAEDVAGGGGIEADG